MILRALIIRWNIWKLKRKFYKDESWQNTQEMIGQLLNILKSTDLAHYTVKTGVNISLSMHYLNYERFFTAVRDALYAIREEEELLLERRLYEQQPETILLDDFLTNNENYPYEPKEILDEFTNITRQLIESLVTCKANRLTRHSYYSRKLSRILVDIVSFYDAMIAVSLSKRD